MNRYGSMCVLLVAGLAASAELAASAAAQAPTGAAGKAVPSSAEDSAAVRRAAMDYIEGWYAGDDARMARALHPELAKRMAYTDPRGRSMLDQMSAMTLVERTRSGGGRQTPPERRQEDFSILDLYQNAAVAKIVASDWVDYLQLVRWNGQWKIVNVLWELKPRPPASQSP